MKINEFAMIAIPTELLEETGIEIDGVIQMYVDGDRLILTPLDDEDFDYLDDDSHIRFDCGNAESSQNLHGGNCGECCKRCSRFGVYCDGCEKGDAGR